MAEFTHTCPCGEEFTAKSPRAKWHSPGCKKAHQRHPERLLPPEPKVPDLPETPLVTELRKELTDAGRLETFAGQLAIALARQVTAVGATGVAGLSKELRAAKAEALAGLEAPPADQPKDPDDELRERRDAKRAAARQAAD